MPEDSMSFLPKDPQGECRGTRRTLSMSKCAWHAWLTALGASLCSGLRWPPPAPSGTLPLRPQSLRTSRLINKSDKVQQPRGASRLQLN